jgi:hypothetical protein
MIGALPVTDCLATLYCPFEKGVGHSPHIVVGNRGQPAAGNKRIAQDACVA